MSKLPASMTTRAFLAPETEIRFIWIQVETLLSSYRSHRTVNVNQRLMAMFGRISDLEQHMAHCGPSQRAA